MHCDLQRIGAGVGSCLCYHRVKDVLCRGWTLKKKNTFKSKNAFVITVGQLVLYPYGSDKKLVDLYPEVPMLNIILDVSHTVVERNSGMRLIQKSGAPGVCLGYTTNYLFNLEQDTYTLSQSPHL